MDLRRILAVALVLLSANALAKPPVTQHDHEPSDEVHYNTEGEHNPEYDHEAFAGSEAEDFQNMDPETAKTKLRVMALKVDTDGNGRITKSELTVWITKQMRSHIDHDVDQQWGNMNTNEDELLTWNEIINGTYGYLGDTEAEDDSYRDLQARDRRRFDRADANNDATLTKEEFTHYLHPEETEHMKTLVVDETIEDLDKNKDGSLSMEEYIGEVYPEDDGKEPEWVTSEKAQFTDIRDVNKDGKLDKDEVAAWILPQDSGHAEEEAQHLLTQADSNKDDELSIDEVVEHHDVFVGSQATNYGSLLHEEL